MHNIFRFHNHKFLNNIIIRALNLGFLKNTKYAPIFFTQNIHKFKSLKVFLTFSYVGGFDMPL